MLAIGGLVTFSACKKEQQAAMDSVSAEDNSEAIAAMNTTNDDAANAVGQMPIGKTGNDDDSWHFCGVNIDDSRRENGSVTITYSGEQCFSSLQRSGSITITMVGYQNGVRWNDAGASITLTYNNLKVTNTHTGKTYTFNGSQTITNVSGGWAWKVMWGWENSSVVYKHTASNFSITFSDGTIRTINISRTRTFSNIGGKKTVIISGDASANGMSNVDIWGTTRGGAGFTSSIPAPIVATLRCGLYNPVGGEHIYHSGTTEVTMLFGVNKDGEQVDSDNCPYGYKITTSDGRETTTKVVSYWHADDDHH